MPFGFLKSRLPLARDPAEDSLVAIHPETHLASHSQCVVGSDDWAVFTRGGRPFGSLDTGRFTLSPVAIPFLQDLRSADGEHFETEVFFVRRTSRSVRVATSLSFVTDPPTGLRVCPDVLAELILRVENPEALVFACFGPAGPQPRPDPDLWLAHLCADALRVTLPRRAEETGRTVDHVGADRETLVRELQNAPQLSRVGVRPVSISTLEIRYGAEDAARIRARSDELARGRG
jgi:hypothetical protein